MACQEVLGDCCRKNLGIHLLRFMHHSDMQTTITAAALTPFY